MDQRLNMVMNPVRDIAAIRAFYEAGLGWSIWGPEMPGSVMYRLGTSVLVFVNRDYLAKEAGIDVGETARIINAVFVNSKAEVDAQMAKAVAAGGTITSPVRDRDGGLYSGYFADPEGNGWEVVWSPHMPVGADGGLTFGGQ
ncbi:MAG: VOC family protein [Sphingomonadaceae bacterium]|nr:VOC family protein [Sphingomonadaceae bacterium]